MYHVLISFWVVGQFTVHAYFPALLISDVNFYRKLICTAGQECEQQHWPCILELELVVQCAATWLSEAGSGSCGWELFLKTVTWLMEILANILTDEDSVPNVQYIADRVGDESMRCIYREYLLISKLGNERFIIHLGATWNRISRHGLRISPTLYMPVRPDRPTTRYSRLNEGSARPWIDRSFPNNSNLTLWNRALRDGAIAYVQDNVPLQN